MAKHADPSVKADALERAKRTLWQSVGVDALVATGLGLTALLADPTLDPMRPLFWATVGGLVVRSTITALASYFARLKVAPSGDTSTDTAPTG